MADDTHEFDDGLVTDGGHAPVIDEAQLLIDDLLDGDATAAGVERLERLVVDHASVAELYVTSMHLAHALPSIFKHGSSALELDSEDPSNGARRLPEMSDAMILPALRDAGVPAVRPDPTVPAASGAQPTSPRNWRIGIGLAAAAAITIAIPLRWHARPSATSSTSTVPPSVAAAPDEAAVTATARVAFDGTAAPTAGASLALDQSIHLREGAMELRLASGATAVVRAPAIFRIVGRNELALDSGSACAHVPAGALGFRMTAPGLVAVDRGTDFGITTVDGGTSSVIDVFEGTVDVTATDGAHRAVGRPVRLTTGKAVSHDADAIDTAPVTADFEPDNFVRNIDQVRLPLTLHGTGTSATRSSYDEDWRLISIPNDPKWRPMSAGVLLSVAAGYVPNTPDSRWIGPSPTQQSAAVGDFTFRTSVDLTGFDPSTVSIVAHAYADNVVAGVRVNGQSVAMDSRAVGPLELAERTINLPGSLPWRAGSNQVDVVVRNLPSGMNDGNYVALKWSWAGTASPVVQRP